MDIKSKQPENKCKNELDFIKLSDLNYKPVDYLINPIIVKNGINLLTAPPASFKSIFSLDIANSCLNGKKLVEKFETKPINCALLIDQETNIGEIKKRISMLDGEQNNFRILSSTIYFDQINKNYSQLKKLLIKYSDSLLIIDTLRRTTLYMNENDSMDVNKVFSYLNELKKLTTILIIHHTAKYADFSGTNRYRGSSDIEAVVDSHFSLKKIKSEEGTVKLILSQPKSRYTSNLQETVIHYQLREKVKGEVLTENQNIMPDYESIFIDYLHSTKDIGSNIDSIYSYFKKSVNIGEKAVCSIRDKLVKENKIIRIDNYKGGKGTRYFHPSFSSQQGNNIYQ